jgi:hypothetical protein
MQRYGSRLLAIAMTLAACTNDDYVLSGGSGAGGGMSSGTGGGLSLGGSDAGSCDGLLCQVPSCEASTTTTIRGTVYAPSGTLPLYNAIVYIPGDPLDQLAPIPQGVTCGRCEGSTSGRPIAAALSDAAGGFVLTDVPAGPDIPLVIQLGKWRRIVTLSDVAPCQDNLLEADLTRLPRNQSEGNLPQIAVTTGHSDALECLLRKIGIDDTEFTTDTGTGRVHMYVGCDGGNGYGASELTPELGGTTFPDAITLWGDAEKLGDYDMLVLSCEGSQCEGEKEPFKANIKAYADGGGKLFLDHLHFDWLEEGPSPWPDSAEYLHTNGDDLPPVFTSKIDTSFPKGGAFADWLVNVVASPNRGFIEILEGQFSVINHIPPLSQRWIYTDENPGDPSGLGVQYMTLNTPVELASNPDAQCGRVVFTDLHVVSASADFSDAATPFPRGCVATDLTPQEKALVFMLFDLSSCVQSEQDPPQPPEIIR